MNEADNTATILMTIRKLAQESVTGHCNFSANSSQDLWPWLESSQQMPRKMTNGTNLFKAEKLSWSVTDCTVCAKTRGGVYVQVINLTVHTLLVLRKIIL